MARPNVVVFGYDELLLESLEFLSQTRTRVSAVVFPFNKTDWRANEIRRIVKEKGFLILEQPPRGEISEFTQKLSRLKPDLIYVWSYPLILPEEILEIPKFGCVNVHLGLLPEYRGVNGVRWALLNGEQTTGVTIHFMDAGIDTGDIIARVSFPILPTDDILSLMKKSKRAGLFLLENSWAQIAAGKAVGIPQDASKAALYTAKMSVFENIDWSRSNVEIHNLIRASVLPFPGVFTFWNEHKLFIRKSSPVETFAERSGIGNIEKIDARGIEVTTGSGNLLITKIEFEDNLIPLTELRNFGLKVGSSFQIFWFILASFLQRELSFIHI